MVLKGLFTWLTCRIRPNVGKKLTTDDLHRMFDKHPKEEDNGQFIVHDSLAYAINLLEVCSRTDPRVALCQTYFFVPGTYQENWSDDIPYKKGGGLLLSYHRQGPSSFCHHSLGRKRCLGSKRWVVIIIIIITLCRR